MLKFFRHLAAATSFIQLPQEFRKVVFYSEGKPYWPHLSGVLNRFLELSQVPVCYLSSDSDDPGLVLEHPRLRKFKIDDGWVRSWVFENMGPAVVVMTTPDLNQYQLKRSKQHCHYVYIQHSLVSQHMAYRPGAFDHFDTVFCAGPHHITELRAMEDQMRSSKKRLVEHGYGRLDAIIRNRASRLEEGEKHVLIAPSWGKHGMLETIGVEVVGSLLKQGVRVTVRPHPETFKHSPASIQALVSEFHGDVRFNLERSVAGQESLHSSHIMISDWSGAAFDYAFGLEKPVLFIDLPNKKINNPDYEELGIEPFEVWVREKVGEILPVDRIQEVGQVVNNLIAGSSALKKEYSISNFVFNVGESDVVGARALMDLLDETFPLPNRRES